MKQLSLRGIFLICGLLGAFCLSALAQEATVVGTVTDPSNAAVPNVAITVTNTDTGQVWRVSTGAAGDYVAADLRIGHFVVRAEATGFKVGEKKDIVLTVGDRLRVDFKLELGSTQQSITVEATPVAVQSDSGEVSSLVSDRQIADLAMNGRSFYNLEALVPGASSLQPDFQFPTSSTGNANVSFNGQREVHNIWLLDGGEDADRGGGGGMSIMPSEDAIAEWRALTSNYSADYGLSSAGTMTMVLKSGTKQFHATAWEFDRNDDLDAVYAFSLTKPELRFNVFGFNVGGPVSLHESGQHKTFFFYNQEWRKLIQGGTLNTNVPDPSEYPTSAGALMTATPTGGVHTPCTNQVDSTIAANFANAGQTLSTADSAGNCGPPPTTLPAGYVPAVLHKFTNNTIPASLIDPNAQILLNTSKIFPTASLVPTGTTGVLQYRGGNSPPTNAQEQLARIDHTFNDKFSVFGHWVSEQVLQGYGTTIWSGDNVPTMANTYGNPAYSYVIHATYSISPTLINETAFNYNGNRIHILPTGTYDAPSGFTFGRVFPGPNADNRIPAINLSGATGTNYTANWVPWNNKADDWQIRDDISWVKGAHQLKMGASWALYKKVQDVFADTQGSFSFNGLYTGYDFADMLLGLSNSYGEDGVHDAGHWNNISPAAYFQDNWRATKRLTLNLGLRWDGIPHTYEANNRYSDFYPNQYNPANAAVLLPNGNIDPVNTPAAALGTSPNSILAGWQFYLNGVGLAGQSGVPKGMVNPDWHAFGPRIGFAYDLTGSGKTVIRGGFGIMYERIQGNDMYDGGTNVPFSAHASLYNVSFENAKLDVATGNVFTTAQAPIVVAGLTGQSLNYPAPRDSQYSLGVERQLGAKAVLSVAYVGSQGRHQSYFQQINNPPQSDLAALIANGDATYNSLVPYRGFNTIDMAKNDENAHYNGLQISLRGQLTRDLTVQAAYTLSKSIDPGSFAQNGGDVSGDSNPYDWRYDMGPGIFDRRQVFFANFIYQIPLLKHSPNHALRTGLGGWELSGIVTAETGPTMNISLGGTAGGNGLPSATNRPDLSGSISYPKTEGAWFSKSAFSTPTPGDWGTAGYDAVYGPGRDNWNISLFKTFSISEARGSRLELRFETFNTFNHVQWNSVDSGFSSGTFGRVTGATDPRVLQLGLKLYF
ncbi:MAG: carboxypeptidase-like regulatory domain-containing protein [Terriglobia bacterium]